MATGGLNQKKWPWGDEAPTTYANFSTEYQADIGMGPVPGPTAAGPRPANSLGLKDVIGNVAEWTFEAYPGGGYGGSSLTAKVYGGSYLGLLSADDPWSGGGNLSIHFRQRRWRRRVHAREFVPLGIAGTAHRQVTGFGFPLRFPRLVELSRA